MANKRAAAKQEPKSVPVVNEGNEPDATRAVAGRNGGTLHPHAPGSNGGVHRGPDLRVRNIFPSILLKALSDDGEVPGPGKRSGAAQRKQAIARHAMTLNTAKALQGIAFDAARGDERARDQLLRIIDKGHEMLQPPKDNGKNGYGHGDNGGPIMPRFSPPQGGSLPTPAVTEPAVPEPPRGIVDAEGNVYEEAE